MNQRNSCRYATSSATQASFSDQSQITSQRASECHTATFRLPVIVPSTAQRSTVSNDCVQVPPRRDCVYHDSKVPPTLPSVERHNGWHSHCSQRPGPSSYMADGSILSEISITEPHIQTPYTDSFARNVDGCLPFSYQTGSIGSATSLAVSAAGDLKTEAPWTEYSAPLMSATSTICSPVQSARGAKRRAMSSSTVSSDIPSDIISLICYSPTEIAMFATAGLSTSSTRPASGSISHLSARNIVLPRTHQHQLTTTASDLHDPLSAVIAMYNLEDHGTPGLDVLDSNQVVVRQHDNIARWDADAARSFPEEIPPSEQNLDEVDQLEYFLRVSAAVEDADCGGPSYGVPVDGGVEQNAYGASNPAPEDPATTEDTYEVPLVCLWMNCGHLFCTQDQLVQHIEQHVDQRCEAGCSSPSSDEFVCHWNGCTRQRRPFNARYKLLIHMRVHSGEKPHKCMVPLNHHA